MNERNGRRGGLAVGLLALLAYVPALASSRGRMPADTKLYLYLDPGRLISDAPWTFDGRQFAGWVPHQVIAYLWPQGPWYWLFDRLGVPDWVAHRLWIATLMFLAGAGVWWCSRRLGLGVAAALAAAVAYQLSPYLLPYISRTSAMLLPWAALGWIVGLTALAATRGRWRHPALVALVVASVGAVNATALLMIAPAPVLWLVVAALERRITPRRAVATAARIGVLGLGVSAWWATAVVIQGRAGADVLAFSESLESVSFTSTSTEVWRGMGYWLDYVRDTSAATTTAAAEHLLSGRVIVAGYLLVVVGLVGLTVSAWAHRPYAIALVVTGVILGVGVHPFDDPSPLMNLLVGDGTSGPGLALRSSTRAVPMLVLGLGLGLGALVDAAAARARARSWHGPATRATLTAAVVVLVLVSLPSLTGRRLVDPALARDQEPPAAWLDAAAALDAAPPGYRVLQLPGQEFGAYRWGYTVDPPLPGLTTRPLITRDLLPLGSGAAMDLAYALDDRFQAGIAERAAVAPVARLLGADTIWLTGDAAFERFRTPRPELVADWFADPGDGLGEPVTYGSPAVNTPAVPMLDETALSDERVGTPVAPVALVPLEGPVPIIRASADEVLVTGSGDGLVDAAAAGLLFGDEAVRYTGTLDATDQADAVRSASRVVLTDSHRDRAHHWRGSQDTTGFTESSEWPGSDVVRVDVADERLDVLDPEAAVTDAVQEGPVVAVATGYGEPLAYRPEDRPAMAVDGDPATAWRVADRADPIGHALVLEADEPVDHITLRQPTGAADVRHIARVTVTVGNEVPIDVLLDERSLTGAGQRIDLSPTTGDAGVTITITGVTVPDATVGPALAAVGFAEADLGLGPTTEIVRLADDVGPLLTADVAVSYVLTRQRVDPTNRWRSDPEPMLHRRWYQATARSFVPDVTVRLDARAADGVLAELLGITGAQADVRLTGVPTAAGWAATDGDSATAWITPFGGAVGATLSLTTAGPTSTLTLRPATGAFSPITAVRIRAGSVVVDAAVDAAGTVALDRELPAGPLTVEITAVETRPTLDRRYGEPVVLPAAVAEITAGEPTSIPTTVDTGCRDDLLAIDGQAVAVRVTAPTTDLLAGRAVTATACGGAVELAEGRHDMTTTTGSGLQIDRVVLDDGGRAAMTAAPAPPDVTVTSSGRIDRDVTVGPCPSGCWLILGVGHHPEWSARTGDTNLGPPQLVAGGFNGWWLEPHEGTVDVALRWGAQTPLTIALVVSAGAIVACLVLAVAGGRRRRDDNGTSDEPSDPADAARWAGLGRRAGRATQAWAAGVWVVLAGVAVGPAWALGAAGVAGVLVVLAGRPRLAGLVAAAVLAAVAVVVVWVVRTERPFPDAGWPVRFEWLHQLGLFAATALAAAAISDHSRAAPTGGAGSDAPAELAADPSDRRSPSRMFRLRRPTEH